MASTARWPRREPPLVPVDGLRDKLLQLRQQGWLTVDVAGDIALVTYGDRVRRLADSWGLQLPQARSGGRPRG